MDTFYGQKGNSSPDELASFISTTLADDEMDAIATIKNKYLPCGHAMAKAKVNPEIKHIGLMVWAARIINPRTGKPYSYQHLLACHRAWLVADKFDAALEWYYNPGRNTPWTAPKPYGPQFVLDLVKAHKDGGVAPARARSSTSSAKELLRKYKLLRAAFERVAAEHRKFAAELDREPRALNEAEQELALDDGGATDFGTDNLRSGMKAGFQSDGAQDDADDATTEAEAGHDAQQAEPVGDASKPPSSPTGSKTKRKKREAALAQTAVAGTEAAEAEAATEDDAQQAEPAGEAPKADDTATVAEPDCDEPEQPAGNDSPFDVFQKELAELMAEHRAIQGSKSNKKFNESVAGVQAFRNKWVIDHPVRPPSQHLATLGLKRQPATLSELTKAYHTKAKDYFVRFGSDTHPDYKSAFIALTASRDAVAKSIKEGKTV
jgi:hypothetical protein